MSSIIVLATPFVLNALMTAFKWGGMKSWTTPGKRTVLAVLAIIGAFAGNYLNGAPVDVDSVSALATTAVEAFLAFIAAHGTYSLLFQKKVK